MKVAGLAKTIVVGLCFGLTSTLCTADMLKGDEAFERGDYKQASIEFERVVNDPAVDDVRRGGAAAKLALIYQMAGDQFDLAKSAFWAEKSHDMGFDKGSLSWADFLIEGWGGVKKDTKKAAVILKKLSDSGYSSAKRSLADLYFEGDGVQKDEKKAWILLNESIELGNSSAALAAARRYVTADGTKLDYGKALALYKKAVDEGNIFGLRPLGAMYLNGLGTPGGKKDYEKATFYLKEAYEKGFTQGDKNFSASTLGDIYFYGEGVLRDRNLGCEWYGKASQGEGFEANWAQVSYGACHMFGDLGKKDEKQAAIWFEKSAAGNVGPAYKWIGILHSDGLAGYRKDDNMAAKMWQKGADLNDATSKFLLGTLYEDGSGVIRDYARAVELYRQAAESNQEGAQNKLGAKFAEGRGVAKDMVQALKWFTISSANGNEKAVDNRNSAESMMTKADVSKAQKMAREWLAKNQK